ncbi:MAG: hypothetical protein QM756_18030 [Polyangiaceae bacterium]
MGRKKQRDDKIIHVVFGPGGGRVQRRNERAATPLPESNGSTREPLTD